MTLLEVRVGPHQLADLDAWIATQLEPRPARPEALRRLAALGLDELDAHEGAV